MTAPRFIMKRPPSHCRTAAGSTLLISLLSVTVLSLIAANVLQSISARYNSAFRSASWNEALLTAEGGIDIISSQFLQAVPDVRATTGGLGTGFSQPSAPLLTGLQISPAGLITNGTVVNLNVWTPTHAGEGSTRALAAVSVDVVPLDSLLTGGVAGALNAVTRLVGNNNLNLVHLVSTGTVYLTGATVAGMSRQDNELWRAALLTDPTNGPYVSRQIEGYLRPVFAFESAVASNDALLATDPGTVFDSFNSTLPTASTAGQYDSTKRLAHATVRANGTNVALGGKVWGDVDTNGGSVAQDSHVSGTVNNASYTPLPLVKTPTWTGVPLLPSSVTGSTTLAAGTALLPTQYKFNAISGSLHITRGLANLGTNVEIFVNGDLTGGIEIDSGVTAKVYVSGSINTLASQLKNDSGLATALQIYGVPPGTGSAPAIRINLDANLAAAIYAPGHSVSLSGNNDVSGAVTAASFQTSGTVRVHYDEALGFTAGPLLRYQIASWKEITN